MITVQAMMQQNTQRYEDHRAQFANDWDEFTKKYQDWSQLKIRFPINSQSAQLNCNKEKAALLPEIEELERFYESQKAAANTIKKIEENMPTWTSLRLNLKNTSQILSDLGCSTLDTETEISKVTKFIDAMTKTQKAMSTLILNFEKELPAARKIITNQFRAVTNTSWGIFDSWSSWPSFEEMKEKCQVPADASSAVQGKGSSDEKKQAVSLEQAVIPADASASTDATKAPEQQAQPNPPVAVSSPTPTPVVAAAPAIPSAPLKPTLKLKPATIQTTGAPRPTQPAKPPAPATPRPLKPASAPASTSASKPSAQT